MRISKKKVIVILILAIMIAQICLPIFQNVSLAIDTVDGWNISISNNGSVVAKLDENGTLVISGTGSMKNWDVSSGATAPWYEARNNITTITISEGVKNIGNDAFIDCTNLTNITMPKSLTTIGKKAFQSCASLTSLNIPDRVISIGNYAFSNCSDLINAEIPEALTSLGEGAFEGCATLANITLPKGISKIGSRTFTGNTSLITIAIPEEVKEIGYMAFDGCTSLTNVFMKNAATNIDSKAFANCNSINIICKSNSNVEKYAKENNIPYVVDEKMPKIEFTTKELENNLQESGITVTVKDDVSGVDENSLKYVWSTKSCNIQIDEIKTSFSNGESIQKEKLTGEYYLWVIAYDLMGNCIIQNTTACDLDDTLPTITVSQSATSLSQIFITVADVGTGLAYNNRYQYYISTSDTKLLEGQWVNYESGAPITIEKGVTQEYYLFVKTINDLAGNISNANGTMVTIDDVTYHRYGPYKREIKPVEFTPNGNEKWEQSVSVKVSSIGNGLYENYKYAWIEESANLNVGDSGINLEGKEFDAVGIVNSEEGQNGKYNLLVIDKITDKIIAKTNVFHLTTDNIKPTIKVLYSTNEKTNDNVTVRIIANEKIQEIEEWELNDDGTQLTKEYESNTIEKVIIKDIVGNEVEAEIKIENIDKTSSEVNVTYSTKEITNQNVIVTISSNKEMQAVEGWKLTEDKKQLTKEYESNIEETIVVLDSLGNETVQSIVIKNIDRVPADLEVKYQISDTNQGEKVIIVAREELQPLEGWELSGDKKQLVKEYNENVEETVIVKDLAGNETTQLITVTNADRKGPTPIVVYSTLNKTDKNVTVIMVCNEQVQSVEGWQLSDDKLTLTKKYETNEKEVVILKDIFGNETEHTINITNISKKTVITEEKHENTGIIEENTENDIEENVEQTESTEENAQKTILKGDVNGDGKIDMADTNIINKHRLGKEILEGDSLLAADVTGDGVVDFKDIEKINRYRTNEIDEL